MAFTVEIGNRLLPHSRFNDPSGGFVFAGPQLVPIRTLREASEVVRAFVQKTGMGASHMTSHFGEVRQGKSGKMVARVSYNGRVWAPGSPGAGTSEYTGTMLTTPLKATRAKKANPSRTFVMPLDVNDLNAHALLELVDRLGYKAKRAYRARREAGEMVRPAAHATVLEFGGKRKRNPEGPAHTLEWREPYGYHQATYRISKFGQGYYVDVELRGGGHQYVWPTGTAREASVPHTYRTKTAAIAAANKHLASLRAGSPESLRMPKSNPKANLVRLRVGDKVKPSRRYKLSAVARKDFGGPKQGVVTKVDDGWCGVEWSPGHSTWDKAEAFLKIGAKSKAKSNPRKPLPHPKTVSAPETPKGWTRHENYAEGARSQYHLPIYRLNLGWVGSLAVGPSIDQRTSSASDDVLEGWKVTVRGMQGKYPHAYDVGTFPTFTKAVAAAKKKAREIHKENA